MGKVEFLQRLKSALEGEVPAAVIQENLRYYDDYIRSESGNGKSEEQVIQEIGDPRLIARTIIDTTPGAGNGIFETGENDSGYGQGGMGNGSYQQTGQTFGGGKVHYYDLSKWYWKLLAIVILAVVLFLVICIITGFLTLVIPLIPLLALIVLIMWFVRGPKR